jgi:hypothetical protein
LRLRSRRPSRPRFRRPHRHGRRPRGRGRIALAAAGPPGARAARAPRGVPSVRRGGGGARLDLSARLHRHGRRPTQHQRPGGACLAQRGLARVGAAAGRQHIAVPDRGPHVDGLRGGGARRPPGTLPFAASRGDRVDRQHVARAARCPLVAARGVSRSQRPGQRGCSGPPSPSEWSHRSADPRPAAGGGPRRGARVRPRHRRALDPADQGALRRRAAGHADRPRSRAAVSDPGIAHCHGTAAGDAGAFRLPA